MKLTEQDKELREKIHSALFADDFPILNDIEKDAVDRILALIRTEKLKLLAEIGEPKLEDAINMKPEQYEGGVIINDWYKNRINKMEAEL